MQNLLGLTNAPANKSLLHTNSSTMETVLENNNVGLLGGLSGDFDGVFDGFGSRVGVEDAINGGRQVLEESLGQIDHWLLIHHSNLGVD